MSRSVFIAIAAAIVGALIVVFYNILVPPPPAPPGPLSCPPNCNVAVMVYGENCSDPSRISAYPDLLPVKRGNSPDIFWEIDQNSPYTFAENGIDFHGNAQFTDGRRLGPKRFKWKDRNEDNLYHKYAINLLSGSAPCPTKDPGIINGQ